VALRHTRRTMGLPARAAKAALDPTGAAGRKREARLECGGTVMLVSCRSRFGSPGPLTEMPSGTTESDTRTRSEADTFGRCSPHAPC
jgi:hypothetical protein